MLLDVENLHTHFQVASNVVARAVDGVSFNVESGRTLALVGESGSGKSQTSFSIMRLLDENASHPDKSKILFKGYDLLKLSESEMQSMRGNQIGMIFQEPMASLNPLLRIGKQMAEPLILHQGFNQSAARERSIELLTQVGIPSPESRIDAFPHELSGGMKQRVMVAIALTCNPRLLIADEPTTALDVTIQAQILGLMKEIQKSTGMGILFITHDLSVVNQMADDVCVMYAGQIVERGDRNQIFNNPQHPYTRRLLESIPSSAHHDYRLPVIPGRVPSATAYSDIGCRFSNRCPEVLPQCHEVNPPEYQCDESGMHTARCLLLDPEKNNIERKSDIDLKPRPHRPTQEKVVVRVENLKTHFPVKKGILQRVVNHVRAVDGFQIEVRRGETLALVGESGSGKTTAGQSILRLNNEATGSVYFQGLNVLDQSRKSLKNLRKHMQIVFQDPVSSLSPNFKVRELIGEGLRVHEPRLNSEQRLERVKATMDLVGLSPELAERFPHEFSGGQRQRIAIARSLILEPELLVLDEPTSALDVSVQSQILNLLEDIQSKKQLAYLFITHDLGVVEYLADQIAVMYLGKIVEYGPTKDVISSPLHPYTEMLLRAVPRIEETQQPFDRISGDVPSPLNPPPGCQFHPRCPLAKDHCRKIDPQLLLSESVKVACHERGKKSNNS